MNYQLTEGTPWKVIVRFALPLLGAFILQQLYNTVDMLVMGNFVSQDALSSVGASGNYLGVFITIATGLSSGITVCVANAYGGGRTDEVRRYIGASMLFQLFVGIVVTVGGILLAKPVLCEFVKLDDSLVPDAVLYVGIYMAGFIFQMIYNAVAGVLRGLGDSRSSLYFLIVAATLNIALDIIFVGLLHRGVVGVAMATTIAQMVCAITATIYMSVNYRQYMPRRGSLAIKGIAKEYSKAVADVIKTATPLMIQAFMLYVGFMVLQRTVNSFGTDLTASYSVVVKVDRYIMGPLVVLFDSMAAYAGQNQGAGRFDRIVLGLRQCRWLAIGVAAVFCIIGLLVMPTVVRWFAMNDVATDYAIRNLKMSSIDLFLYALYCPITGMCLGLKQTIVPMIVSFIELSGRNIFARLLAPMCGPSCIWFCEPPAWIVVIICVWLYYYLSVRPKLMKELK